MIQAVDTDQEAASKENKEQADKEWEAAFAKHQEAAQAAESATIDRKKAEDELAASEEAVGLAKQELPEAEAMVTQAQEELDTARQKPEIPGEWPNRRKLLGSGGHDLHAEAQHNQAIRDETGAARALRNTYNFQLNSARQQISDVQGARAARTAAHNRKVAQEIERHRQAEIVLRGRFVRVMALCQRQAWQVDVAKRAVKARKEEQEQAVARADELKAAIGVEETHLAQAQSSLEQSVTSLATIQERLKEATDAGDDAAILNAENSMEKQEQTVAAREQTVTEVQDRLVEAKGASEAADNVVASGETAIAALEDEVKSAAVGNCYHGDCETLEPEGPSTPQETVRSLNN